MHLKKLIVLHRNDKMVEVYFVCLLSGGAEVGHKSIPTYDKKVCGESRKSLGG